MEFMACPSVYPVLLLPYRTISAPYQGGPQRLFRRFALSGTAPAGTIIAADEETGDFTRRDLTANG
jgi:hypothetical protein